MQDLAEPLVKTLMSIVEDPATRRYVRPQLELHQLLTGFTDLDAPPGPERAHRWQVGGDGRHVVGWLVVPRKSIKSADWRSPFASCLNADRVIYRLHEKHWW